MEEPKVGDRLLCRRTHISKNHGSKDSLVIFQFGKRYRIDSITKYGEHSKNFYFLIGENEYIENLRLHATEFVVGLDTFFVVGKRLRKLKLKKIDRKNKI